MKIIVIDNNQDKVLLLTDLLKEAFPHADVLPEPGQEDQQTFTEWDAANEFLKTIPDDDAILCMDLALMQEDYNDSIRGLEAGELIRAKRKGWVLLAYTQFGRRIEPEAAFRETFDGIIEKSDISARDRKGRVSYVQSAIEAAIRKHAHGKSDYILPADVYVKDSLGMRTFRAAFGDAALAELAHNEAHSWSEIVVAALTTGHSGAFMVSLNGNTSQGPKSLVLKVTKDDRIIQDEINAPTRFLEQLGPLSGTFATLDNNKRSLAGNAGVYYRQSLVSGQTLLETLAESGKTTKQRVKVLKAIVKLCIGVCRSIPLPNCAVTEAKDAFKLSPIDLGRLETSAQFLRELGSVLKNEGLWPDAQHDPDRVIDEAIDMSKSWSARLSKIGELPTVVQHGDLNPGNVILPGTGSFVLIDLSRLGHWPIGYDLARLSLMLRIRLVDGQSCRDWLPDRIGNWLSESVAGLGADIAQSEALCPESVYCDQQFYSFLESTKGKYKDRLAFGYKVGSIWDLLKIISYQDLSPFKRMWALLECWRLSREIHML